MRTLNKQELEDLIRGCAILGTGGGGNPKPGLAAIQADLQEGRVFKLAKLEEVPDAAWVATPSIFGGVFPDEGIGRAFQDDASECLKAFETLEDYLGKRFFAAFPAEIGGAAAAEALAVATRRGIPIIDADAVGRAVPELQHSMFNVQHMPSTPLAVATTRGDIIILKEVADDLRGEAIIRALAAINGNNIGVVSHPLEGRSFKKSIIAGTLSKAMAIGAAVREARSSGTDPVEAVITAQRGYLLFKGKVVETSWKLEGGFTTGESIVSGADAYLGHRYRICYKNENIISWFDDQPDVTVPDLICVLDPKTGEAITNPNCKKGMNVVVTGCPAPKRWRSSRGLALFGPQPFGYETRYRPIEENTRLGRVNRL